MGDGGCLRPQLPRDYLQDVRGEPRECQPWVSLKSGLGFPKGGFALSQEVQNHPPQQHHRAGIVPSVSLGCMEKPGSRSRCSQR